MALMYTIFSSESEGAGATVIFSDGTIQQISQDNDNYGRVVNTLTSTPVDAIDEVALLELLIPALGVGKSLNRLSERVSFDGANVLFDGDVVSDAIADHILRIVKEGGNPDSYKALVAFMEKLYTNPSEASRNSLYNFIVRHKITIDPDGDFYAYKGVNADLTSIMSGFGIVDGVSMVANLPNHPGSILEMPRAKVDADVARGCSVGLHAGTHKYASGWARGMLLLVKINPRDVVSVPDCSTFQKIRTCRYKVISQTVQETTATTYTAKVGTDLHSINTLTKMTDNGEKVPVTFTYTRGNGEVVVVEITVSEIRKNGKGESIVVGEDADRETRNYRATYISELVIDEDALLKHAGITTAKVKVNPRDVVSVPKATATGDIDALRAGIANDDVVRCDFNYVKVDGTPRRVENFEASEIRKVGWSAELLVGEREDGETRTYRLDRVTDLVVQVEEEDRGATAPVSGVVDVDSIYAAVIILEALHRDGEEVGLNFTYTKKSGVIRTVNNFVATEIRSGDKELIVGKREDGKIRSYLLHRMSDIELLSSRLLPVVLPVAVRDIPKNQRTHLGISVDKLKEMVANGGTVLVDFKYTTVTGESRTVEDFEADGISGSLLIGNRHEDGETRRYRLDNITNVVVHGVV